MIGQNSDISGVSKLIFDLTSVGVTEADLEMLLQRLYDLLNEFSAIPVRPRGAILLHNPRHQLVCVATYGLCQRDPQNPLDNALEGLAPEIRERAYVTSLTQELGPSWASQDARFLVLPLTEGPRAMGVCLLCIDPAWKPNEELLDFLTDIAHVVSGVVSRCSISETLGVRELELEEARADAIRRLGSASEYRDNETGMHVMRMTHYASAIAKALNLPEDLREQLAIAAPMHDVGKIGIRDAILLKPAKLTAEEFEVMKTHTLIGGKLLKGEDSLIGAAREIALSHHEHWDGSGYPAGLKGEEIPILGRICAVADVFDALTTARPYKQPWNLEQAVEWISAESGQKFDPAVVDAFHRAMPDLLRVKALYREEIIDPNEVVELPELAQAEDCYVKWGEEYRIGIDVIDQHHRYLFDLVNDLQEVVSARRGSRQVARILNALAKYAEVHFRAEERMMEHYGYPALERQKHQHAYFERMVGEFYDELHHSPLTAQFDILLYLRDWLIKHIRVEDGQLR
ncbi:MAG: bacteriohemerythrin, partial [Gammaproteobacteria bacterium]|nr:bacteriohemerythrin [Gammaproteobacteria bacterium]